MRFLLIIILAVISFVGTLVGILAVTGNLSKESLQKLVSPSPATQKVTIPQSNVQEDTIATLIEQIQKKEASLKQKEEEIQKKEEEIKAKSQELQQMQSKIESIQKELSSKLGEDKKEKAVQMQAIAVTLSGMKPDKAAERLKTMNPDEIAEILSYVKPKERGKIVEALDAQLAAQVLQALQKVQPPSTPSS
ncbi:MAG TPA: hypothetical protein PLA12_01770 [Candidatus Hydrogenedens sp.]|nr:hypothetical protein [Candidatus Hydrogenedens sp.]